jgi:tetratricopeptide (TPR) repeat protein
MAATSDSNHKALIYPVLAMALHHAGHRIGAREALQAAGEAIDRRIEAMYRGSAGGRFNGLGPAGEFAWWNWIECQVYYRQAKLLIDGAAPSEDLRLLVLRARALAAIAQRDAAGVQFAALLKLRPDDAERQMEYYQNAAASAADRRQWREAADGFSKASELAPDDSRLLFSRSMALLLAGDLDGYRAGCQALIEQFGNTEVALAGDIAFCCALVDGSIPDMQRLIPPAQLASGLYHRSYILGAALYRAGRYEESIQCLESTALAYQPSAWDWTFLAMAHHRLGHTREANRSLAEAARWIEAASKAPNVDLSDTQPTWRRWYEPGLFPLLFREAESLVNSSASATAGGVK